MREDAPYPQALTGSKMIAEKLADVKASF